MNLPEPIATAARARAMLNAEAGERIEAFLTAAQAPDGGFRNRAGDSDLYYTVFGMGCRLALGTPLREPHVTREFIEGRAHQAGVSFVSLVSLIRCYRCLGAEPPRAALQERLAEYRSADGGYSHERKRAGHGTLYAAFLAEQAYEDLGRPMPGAGDVLHAIEKLKTADGGYANHAGTRQATTTATASAAILFARRVRPAEAQAALACLDRQRSPAGGYRASPATPFPDLLSTATAVYAQALCAWSVDGTVLDATARFVESLWHEGGGFRGHPADPLPDVEYSFYALLCLGSIAVLNARKRSSSGA